MIPPNRAPIVGKAANDTLNGSVFERFKIDESWTPVETWYRATGRTSAAHSPWLPRRKPAAPHADYRQLPADLPRQPDGSWRMMRDMFNSDQPPTAERPFGGN